MHSAKPASPLALYWLAAVLALLVAIESSCGGKATDPPTPSIQPPTPSPVTTPPAPTPAPATNDIQHVLIVVEENKNFNDVIGSTDMPFVNSLAGTNGVATNFFGNGIDSLPNYFMLTVGDTVASNAAFTGVVSEDNVVRELKAANKTWKAYAESIPSAGYLGNDQPPYIKVHNPFAYLSDVVNDSAQAANIVPFTQFAADLAAGHLPDYSFIIPNNSSNSHDCPPNMTTCTLSDTLSYSDNWLKTNIGPLVADADFKQHGLLIITWDESRTDTTVNGGGHVATIIVGAGVKPGFQSSTMFQHQSTLRLMLKALGVTNPPNQAASAPDMGEFFSKPLP